MKTAERRFGDWGEKQVQTYLKKHRYRILETNYQTRFCEIDIIARKADVTAFIEVKTRQNLNKGLPRESVTAAKQKKILQGAALYMKSDPKTRRIRFDVAEVYAPPGDPPKITLIKNAFQGGS